MKKKEKNFEKDKISFTEFMKIFSVIDMYFSLLNKNDISSLWEEIDE